MVNKSFSSYSPTHTHSINYSLREVFDHVHGGDNGEGETGGEELKGARYVFTHLLDVAMSRFFVGGLDDGEEIRGGGGITIGDCLHGGVPRHGDGGGTEDLRGVGEAIAVDVGLLDVSHVGKWDAAAVDAEEEEVTSKGQGARIGKVGVTQAMKFFFRKYLPHLLGGHGGLDALEESQFGGYAVFRGCIVDGIDLVDIKSSGRFFATIGDYPCFELCYEVGREMGEG